MRDWRAKFAILGSTYARALSNAATRGGRALAPAMESQVAQIAAQPQAQLRSGLGQFFREHAGGGAQVPTQPQRQMQDMLARVPWATEEHGGSPHAESTLNAMLQRRGLSHSTPAGQPTTQQQIAQRFGPPRRPPPEEASQTVRKDLSSAAKQEPRDGDIWDLRDKKIRTPGAIALPGDTRARPAPMTQPMPINRPDPQVSARASSIGGAAAGRGDSTAVLPRPATTPPAAPAPAPAPAAPPRQFPRARFQAGKIGAALPFAAGAALPLAVGGALLARKPGIKADIANRLSGAGDIHQQDAEQAIPDEVQGQAARAAQAFAERGIDPSALRIAVDAPAGAGKTVLSKALAQQMGLRHHGLDWRPHLGFHQLMGGGDVEKTPYAPHAGEILEHQQLLRSYDPELFDVAMHIHRDPQTIRDQVLHRGRDARQHDLLDYDKSIDVGRRAFDTLGGDAIDLGGGVMMKIRPQAGWGDALDQQLAQRGIDATGLTRHQKLLSLHSGQREEHGAGWTPYVKNPFSGAETAAIGASIPIGVMAARALARRPV